MQVHEVEKGGVIGENPEKAVGQAKWKPEKDLKHEDPRKMRAVGSSSR